MRIFVVTICSQNNVSFRFCMKHFFLDSGSIVLLSCYIQFTGKLYIILQLHTVTCSLFEVNHVIAGVLYAATLNLVHTDTT